MRILHVIPSLGPLRGGPSTVTREMARGLARAEVEVHVVTTDDNGRGRLRMPVGVPIADDGVTYWYFRRQIRFYTFCWPLASWLGRHVASYDVVHIHSLFTWPMLAAAWWAARRGIPYVVGPLGVLNHWGMTRRRRLLKKVSFHLLDRQVLARAALIHYTSEQERLEAARFGFDDRAAVVPLGIDLAPLKHLPKRRWLASRAPHLAGRTVLLFLSRIDAIKGLDLLLGAFASLRNQGASLALVVAGSGPPKLETALRHEAANLGLRDDVLWAGFLEGQEKLAALAEADVFVLPSHSESFGVAVVEAMACGIPVVISDQVGIHREVSRAGAGLVAPCEVGPLSAAIKRMLVDEDLRRTAGGCGRRLVEQRFSIDAMTAGLLGMYDKTLRPAQAVTSVD